MSKTRVGTTPRSNDQLIASIADRTRRRALLALQERLEPVDTTTLATHVAAAVSGEDLVEVTRGDREAFHVQLVHSHLPKLDDVGLVDWDRDEDVVSATDHPALDDGRFQDLLDGDADDWDAVLRAIQPERRRIALAVLDDADGVGRRELARRVVARETGVAPADVTEGRLEDALVTFHHRHVPALQRAGLVGVGDETVRYDGHSDLDADLLTAEPFELSRDGASDTDSEKIDTVDGRLDAIAPGHRVQ